MTDYINDNAAELASLVELRVTSAAKAKRAAEWLKNNFSECEYMDVSERVDMALDLV